MFSCITAPKLGPPFTVLIDTERYLMRSQLQDVQKSISVMSFLNLLLKVEPLLARQLYYFAQQNSGHFLRGYDVPEHISSPEDYHRSIRHSSIQEWRASRRVVSFPRKYLSLTRTADWARSFCFEKLGNWGFSSTEENFSKNMRRTSAPYNWQMSLPLKEGWSSGFFL